MVYLIDEYYEQDKFLDIEKKKSYCNNMEDIKNILTILPMERNKSCKLDPRWLRQMSIWSQSLITNRFVWSAKSRSSPSSALCGDQISNWICSSADGIILLLCMALCTKSYALITFSRFNRRQLCSSLSYPLCAHTD